MPLGNDGSVVCVLTVAAGWGGKRKVFIKTLESNIGASMIRFKGTCMRTFTFYLHIKKEILNVLLYLFTHLY